MPQKSHIAQVRERFESNRLFILRDTGITEHRYNEIFFEQAMAFIDLEYPRHTEFHQCRQIVYSDDTFWAWWRMVYKTREDEFISFIKPFKKQFSERFYIEEMEQITHETQTAQMFYEQYQKPIYASAKKHWKAAV